MTKEIFKKLIENQVKNKNLGEIILSGQQLQIIITKMITID